MLYIGEPAPQPYSWTPASPGQFNFYPRGHVERMARTGEWADPKSPHYRTEIQRLDALDDAINDARRARARSGHGQRKGGY